MNLTNNTILITGGTSGFGLEFTKEFIKRGNTVIITGRNQVKLEEVKKQFPQVYIFQSDVSDPVSIEELFIRVTTQFPGLNILINNAGEMRKINLHDTIDLHEIVKEIDINLSGPIRMVQQFLPHLKKQKTAAILNVTSGIALGAFPIAPIYGATKSGLRSYTTSLRAQLKRTNIKVFELTAPGAKTPLNDKFKSDVDSNMLMAPDKLIAAAIKGMAKDNYVIYPGAAKLIYFLSRLAPGLVQKMMSGSVDKMLGVSK